MFKELQTLIKTRPLTLTVVPLTGDTIRICVIPQSLEADKKINDKARNHKEVSNIPDSAIDALTTPLCLEGTAEELDAEMAEKLTKYTDAHGALRGSLDRAQEEIAKAVQAIEERDKEKAKSKSKQSSAASKENRSAHGKASSGKESTAEEKPETRPSDTLPLEWIAPPSGSASSGSNTDPVVNSVQEVSAE
jgi:PRTRC genetic system protein E